MSLDMDQVFYPGLISDEDKILTKNHPAWPIILALHYNTGQKIFVTEVSSDNIFSLMEIIGEQDDLSETISGDIRDGRPGEDPAQGGDTPTAAENSEVAE